MANALRRMFKIFNKFFMVPLFRLGLGAIVGNPFTGYIMVIKTIGRKTGRLRYTPVNYALQDGKIYCMAGFGKGTNWYRNLQAQPKIEIILPSGPLAGAAEDATNSEEAIHVFRQILKNSGFAGFLAGINAFSISDSELQNEIRDYRLVRIIPVGIGSGAEDAGGWLWILMLMISVLGIWLLLR